MSSSPKGGRTPFPDWVPREAQEAFNDLYSIVTLREAQYMLQRLATRSTMKDAWAELKNFKKVTPDYLVALTFTGWLSAMRSEQQRGYAPPPLGTDPARIPTFTRTNWPPAPALLPITCERSI